MSTLTIQPNTLQGKVIIPPSKSMAHRAIIGASLAKGISIIERIDLSDDMIATINGMRALGAKISLEGSKLIIDGTHTLAVEEALVDCNESGSTLRFLVPLSLATPKKVRFVGRGNLGKRPLDTFYNLFDEKGIQYAYKENSLDLQLQGQLKGGHYEVAGNISSQFITGLLFTLPLLKEDSTLHITTEVESKGYIDLTLQMLEKFGIEVVNEKGEYQTFFIKGNQSYKSLTYTVEGDYSQAAFYLVAAALGNKVESTMLNFQSLQGDKACIRLLEDMGSQSVYENENTMTMVHKPLKGIVIDAKQYPDIIPILTVALSLSEGEGHIINGGRLRIKECDRLHAIAKELNALGACIEEYEDSLTIKGVKTLKGGVVHSHEDHRIAMSMAIASTRCLEPVTLIGSACVSKSYPSFWEDFKKLGGQYVVEEEKK